MPGPPWPGRETFRIGVCPNGPPSSRGFALYFPPPSQPARPALSGASAMAPSHRRGSIAVLPALDFRYLLALAHPFCHHPPRHPTRCLSAIR